MKYPIIFRSQAKKEIETAYQWYEERRTGLGEDFFLDLQKQSGVAEFYFTGMLNHSESDFYISYIDPISQTVRKYFPDFLGGEIKN